MNSTREHRFQLAPKDPDNPGIGPGSSRGQKYDSYEEEYPRLPPVSTPDVAGGVQASSPNGKPRGSHPSGADPSGSKKRSQSDARRSSGSGTRDADDEAAETTGSSAALHSQSTTDVDGSPVQRSRPYRFGGDCDGERSPSEGSENQRHSRPHKRAPTEARNTAKRDGRGGQLISRRTSSSGASPMSFGDDLDERSSESDSDEDGGGRQHRRRGWGLRLTGWNTPMHRRLQTLVVLIHCLFMGILFTSFCFICTVPVLWPVIAIYLVYIRLSTAGTDGKDTLRNESFRRSRVWRYFAAYFPAALHKTADLPPTRKYIFCVHPHGIISHGAWAAFATEALGFSDKFPGITNHLLTLNGNFKTPLYREYLLTMGLQSVSKESITNLLTRGGTDGEGMGRAVTIVVGGAREALEGSPKTMRLIMSRKGFCRMALRTGADVVPVLVFGENDIYSQWTERDHPRFHRLQMKLLSWMGFSMPVLKGRGVFNYDFGILPRRCPLNVVVGKPIPVEQIRRVGRRGSVGERDLEEETNALHALYKTRLVELYEAHKDTYFKGRKEEMEFID